MSFLNENSDVVSHVCGAQLSVAMIVIDERRWKAHAFIDTYFDEEEDRESAQDYHEDMGLDDEECVDGLQVDPLGHGEFDANLPIWNPLQYFLRVLETRIRQVKAKWEDLVKSLEIGVKQFVSDPRSEVQRS